MSPRHHKPFVLTDVDPSIAMADAIRWEREKAVEQQPKRLFAHDLMKQARVERSAYQAELILRFAAFVASSFVSPHHAVAKLRHGTKRQTNTRSV